MRWELADVPADHWALRDIRRLYDAGGIVVESAEDSFRGNEQLGRYDMAQVLARLRGRFLEEVEKAVETGE